MSESADSVDDEVVLGQRRSVRAAVRLGLFTALVIPGGGALILPLMLLTELHWIGLAWVAVWTTPALLVYWFEREHRLGGCSLVSTYRHGVVTRRLGDVITVGPAPALLPYARLRFADGSSLWVFDEIESVVAMALACSPLAENHLPPGAWVRQRKILWFVVWFVLEVGDI